jgi:heptosyltransferase III
MDILFITSTRIGDAVLSSGLLDGLAQTHKAARITVACGALAAPLFEAAPGVVRVIAIEKRSFAGHWLRLWADVALRSWDMVIDLRASAIAWTLFAGQRFVFRTNHVPGHRIEQLAALINAVPPPAPRIYPSVAARRRAKELIPDGEPVLAIGPTANWVGKQWPSARFAETVQRLTESGGVMPGARVAVLGAGSERSMAQPVLGSVPDNRLIDLVGDVDILTAAACLERCALYLGNDSGLMHLAGAVGIPVVGLFGPSREAHYAPWGETGVVVRGAQSYDQIAAQPGFDLSGSDSYMTDLGVAPVVAAAEALLGSASTPGGQF